MPLIKIDIEKGQNKDFLISLMQLTMDCAQEILKLPSDDRNIRLMEYDKGLFFMKPPYRLIIEISMFSGRTIDTKRKLYQLIVNTLNDKLGIDKNEVFILINEQPKENWGVRGGIPASEIDLGFKVEI
jgi:4-oxalocrotonate tautomerase family enzyme